MGMDATNPLSQLEPDDLRALIEFKEQRTSGWKFALLAGWERAKYAGPLQRIRNEYGPAWLAKVKDAHFDALVPRPMALIEVTVDGLPRGESVQAYSNGMRWNGFEVPSFTLEGMRKLALLIPSNLSEGEGGVFLLYDAEASEDDDMTAIKPVSTLINGNPVSLYSIDDWAWEKAEVMMDDKVQSVPAMRPRMR